MNMTGLAPLCAAALLTFGASQAGALPLTAGDTIAMTATTVAETPELAGSVVNDDLIFADLDSADLFAAGYNVQNRVVDSALLDTLIFGPRLRDPVNTLGTVGILYIDGFSISGYGDFAVDASYRTDGLGDVGPTSASRSADGDTLTFDFGFPLVNHYLAEEVHQTSYFLSLVTDATAFENTGIMTIFGRGSLDPTTRIEVQVGGIAVPVAAPAVPLPASAFLLIGALGGVAGMKRRKRLG